MCNGLGARLLCIVIRHVMATRLLQRKRVGFWVESMVGEGGMRGRAQAVSAAETVALYMEMGAIIAQQTGRRLACRAN